MNKSQRTLVVISLVGSALILSFLFIGFGDAYYARGEDFILYKSVPRKEFSDTSLMMSWQQDVVVARGGISGVLAGIVAPILLCTAAGFLWLGRR